MDFEFRSVVNRPLEDVFVFFRDIDQHAGRKGSIVPVLEKTTPGSVSIGTRYYEVVQILPFVTGKIVTEVVACEANRRLGYRFVALGMNGELSYLFQPAPAGTEIVQMQSLYPVGFLRIFKPVIGVLFSRMASKRLSGIKKVLESGILGDDA